MARRFFVEKVPNNNHSLLHIIIVLACVIGVIICFVIIGNILNKSHKEAVFEFRNPATVLLNNKVTDETSTFFKELRNVKEKDIAVNYDNVDFNTVGTYDVIITIYDKEYTVKLDVVDLESPVLATKDVNIENGYEYTALDFVDSCSDNSKQECQYKFYDLTTDEDGNPIDYSTYKENGEYTVLIVAYDESGNETAPTKANLVIGTPSESGEILCKYGNNEYDTTEYVLATYITQNNCSLDLNLYNDEKTVVPANQIMENDTARLKKEFESLNINAPVTLNRLAQAVINNDGTGIVGYTVHMEASIDNIVVESYYINLNGQRIYSVNEYNLK